jgi:hypothetical protein
MGPLRLLLDTHTLYWWHRGDPALSAPAKAAIADSQTEKYVSAITAWEFITKFVPANNRSLPELPLTWRRWLLRTDSSSYRSPCVTRRPPLICRLITGTQWIGFSLDKQLRRT